MKEDKIYTFWHGTSSGEGDNTQSSFFKKGGLVKEFSIRSPFQNPGVYLSQSRNFSEGHARGSVLMQELAGVPLLVETALTAEDLTSRCDFDYEFGFGEVCTFLESFKDEIKLLWPLEEPIKVYDPQRVGLRIPDGFEDLSEQSREEWHSDLQKGLIEKFRALSLQFTENQVTAVIEDDFDRSQKTVVSSRQPTGHDLFIRKTLEIVCHKLESLYPQKYKECFSATMQSLAENEKIWGIKYIADQPLPIKSITSLKR
jgi:hypothetical protein